MSAGKNGLLGRIKWHLIVIYLVLIAVVIYWFNPAGNPTIDMIALGAIGFLIYGPVVLIGLHALQLVPKKAAGTTAIPSFLRYAR